jgi:hypothetical protein
MSESLDIIFICSAIVFNISVSVLYIATKLDNMLLLCVCGKVLSNQPNEEFYDFQCSRMRVMLV